MPEIPDCLKPPEMQCVNCWHRWKPAQHFRDTPRCPECSSTWLIKVEDINTALRKEHEHKRIYAAFHEANGNYSQAGRLLGVSPGFIHTRIKRGNFSPEEVLSGEYLNKR